MVDDGVGCGSDSCEGVVVINGGGGYSWGSGNGAIDLVGDNTESIKIINLVHRLLVFHLALAELPLIYHLLYTNKYTIPKHGHWSNFPPLCCILRLVLLFPLYHLKKKMSLIIDRSIDGSIHIYK